MDWPFLRPTPDIVRSAPSLCPRWSLPLAKSDGSVWSTFERPATRERGALNPRVEATPPRLGDQTNRPMHLHAADARVKRPVQYQRPQAAQRRPETAVVSHFRQRTGNRHAVEDFMANDQNASALAECESVRESIASKADKNKFRARAAVLIMTGTTASIPVFIGLSGSNFLLGKVIPSILAAVAALAAALVQLERPHERWNLYRKYQRIVEGEIVKFKFAAHPYDEDNRAILLAQKVADLQLQLHDEWSGLLPSRTELGATNPAQMG